MVDELEHNLRVLRDSRERVIEERVMVGIEDKTIRIMDDYERKLREERAAHQRRAAQLEDENDALLRRLQDRSGKEAAVQDDLSRAEAALMTVKGEQGRTQVEGGGLPFVGGNVAIPIGIAVSRERAMVELFCDPWAGRSHPALTFDYVFVCPRRTS